MIGSFNVAINGYGVGDDACSDPQLARYLSPIAVQLRGLCNNGHALTIYLMGGATSSASVSEASYMREWFLHHGGDELVANFVLIEPKTPTQSAQDNLRLLKEHCGDRAISIYCLDAREWKMRFFVRQIGLQRAMVCGVDFARFDSHRAALAKSLVWLAADVVEVLGHKVPPLGWASRALRVRHIKAERKKREVP